MQMVKISILMCSKNGERYLREQICSIENQVGVISDIFISDDSSTDDTLKIVEDLGLSGENLNKGIYGSAAKNFFNLIIEHKVSDDTQFIFLSDQDDIWLPNKCIRAIEMLQLNGADAYSGSYFSVSNRKVRYVNKARDINGVDHVFASPGPGFTFALRRKSFVTLQNLLRTNRENLEGFRWHDYAIYFIAIENDFKWVIDDEPVALYRLHGENDTGQANNVKGIIFRMRFLLSGRYRQQVLHFKNFAVLPRTKKILKLVEHFNFISRLQLLGIITASRKTLKDRVMIALWVLISKR